jgi:hypothetical protein
MDTSVLRVRQRHPNTNDGEVLMTEIGYDDRTRAPNDGGAMRRAASGVADAAGTAASDTADTAKEQAEQVVGEVKFQARNVASDVRERVGAEARTQNDRLAGGLRRFADELDQNGDERDDSPARSVVSQVCKAVAGLPTTSPSNGPEGVLNEVPGLRASPSRYLFSGGRSGRFVAGRLGKGILNASSTARARPRARSARRMRFPPRLRTAAVATGFVNDVCRFHGERSVARGREPAPVTPVSRVDNGHVRPATVATQSCGNLRP